ncbi:hypothetical protein BT69DRAFT_1275768 [Atractiella rhizophila]|nr:hypothetical protein BT69DRAFT_1275768 [Atractiella rhizophila]
MTEKMKTMTARLDSRRALPRAGIPVPRTSGAGLVRTNSKKDIFGSSVAGRQSVTSRHASDSSKSTATASTSLSGKSSPITEPTSLSSNPRRSSLHQSFAAPSATATPGGKLARRSHSRLSSTPATISATSRPTTPGAPTTRSPTPSELTDVIPPANTLSKRTSMVSTASEASKRSSLSGATSPIGLEDLTSSGLSLSSSTTSRIPPPRRKSVNSPAGTGLPVLKQSTAAKGPLNQSVRPRSGTGGDAKQLARWR